MQELSYQTSLLEPNAEIYMAKPKVYSEQEQKVKRHKIILPGDICVYLDLIYDKRPLVSEM